jgi:hypothetical protein
MPYDYLSATHAYLKGYSASYPGILPLYTEGWKLGKLDKLRSRLQKTLSFSNGDMLKLNLVYQCKIPADTGKAPIGTLVKEYPSAHPLILRFRFIASFKSVDPGRP